MTQSEEAAFEEVRAIIADYTGIDRARIAMRSDLYNDLGIAGDDADDLFAVFDDAFAVDWTGLDLGVHFGNEGFLVAPLPWQLKNNCAIYQRQPCKVSDVVRAVCAGRWSGTPQILRPRLARLGLYLMSAVQFIVMTGTVALTGGALLVYAFD